MPVAEQADKEVFTSGRARQAQAVPAGLLRIEVIHELLEHELIFYCGGRKHAVGEDPHIDV